MRMTKQFMQYISCHFENNIDPRSPRNSWGTPSGTRTSQLYIAKKMAEDSRDEVASQVPFNDLCYLLEKISNTSGTEKKKKILSTFLTSWREAHRKLHKDSPKTVRLD